MVRANPAELLSDHYTHDNSTLKCLKQNVFGKGKGGLLFKLMYLVVLPSRMLVCYVCAVLEEASWIPEAGATDGCEPLCGCWEGNPEEHPVSALTGQALSPALRFVFQ